MFKDIIGKKLKYLNDIADSLSGFTDDDIENSSFPIFFKNFLKEESKNITDRNQLDSLLDKSVKLQINYAIRPKWTLINYLYGGFDSKSVEEILRKAKIFQFYKFYNELISSYLKSNTLLFITSSKVEELINETNSVLYEKLMNDISGVKIKNFFIQIFRLKYGDEKDVNLEDSIPFVFIRLFLEDKSYFELLEKFKIIDNLKDDDEVELKVMIKVLMDKYVKDTETVPAKEENGIPENQILAATSETIIPIDTKKEKTVKKIKIDNKFDDDNNEFTENQKEVETVISENGNPEEELNNEFFEHHKPGPESKKIRRIFKEGELNIIAKKIFKSSRMSMFSAFEDLEKLKTWDEAVAYLKDLFKKNRVDRYNKYVVLFIDLLNDYYTNIEKGYI